MKYYLKDLDGKPTDIGVRVQRINVSGLNRIRARSNGMKPVIPIVKYLLPNGTTEERQNAGDPAYIEFLKLWRDELKIEIEKFLIEFGVLPDDLPITISISDQQREALSNVIYAISHPTESGIQQAFESVDPLMLESIVTARWADIKIDDFFQMSVDQQNLLIAARRSSISRPSAKG